MKTRMLALTTVVALYGQAFPAEPVAKQSITPVQAELIADLNARLLKVGAAVYARVTVDWHGADCVLRNGAILEAHVVSVVPHTKTVKSSELGLAFTHAQCGGAKMGPFELMLAAMAAPPADRDYGIMSDSLPIMTAGGPSTYGAILGIKQSQMGAMIMQDDTGINDVPTVPQMKMGEVSGIKGMKLDVGAGPENSSTLTIAGHDVALEKHTLLLLVPANGTYPRMAASSPSANASASAPPTAGTGSNPAGSASGEPARAPAETAADDIDLCAPPQCNVALPAANIIDLGKPAETVSIRQIGYAARPQRVTDSFDNDEALAWLGPKELLVAFNPHMLAPRRLLGKSGWTLRVIRAALIDPDTRRVTRTVDWDLPDDGPYLWPLAGGRTLIHAGSELRVYGEGLKIEKRIPLDGPLAFVRVTPDKSFIAIGVMHERHTPELHAALRESLGGDPEEDVAVTVLNREFEKIAQSSVRSHLMPPTLLDEGQARMLAGPDMRFRIAMHTWDGRDATIARFRSSCAPELSSLAPDLLFLVSCAKQSEGREYRILRTDGNLELRGLANLNECGLSAQTSADGQEFVVKTVQSGIPMTTGALFSGNDLTSEELGVYRARDGKRLLAARVGTPSTSRDGFALSNDGSELAVMTRDQIAIFSVPQK